MNKYPTLNKKGFTIIEVLVAGFIFSILLTLIGGIFAQTMNLQRRVFSAQEIQENTFYIIETISRDIRESRICTPGACVSGAQTSLQVTHPTRGVITYSLDVARGVITKNESGTTVDISSPNVNFTRFNFYPSHWMVDNMQSKVVIVISVKNRSTPTVIIDSQATVIPRDFSDEFLN